MPSDLKVYIRPEFAGPDQGEGGIRRWVDMQHKYLPEYGVLPVESEDAAEIVACHAGDLVPTKKPLVCHNHGLYNTANQDWSKWAWQLNAHVIELLRRADIATVPSEWVRMQVARGMAINPRVMYAGIEPELWEPSDAARHVLWNKTRVDPVCDPLPLNVLARKNPNLRFVSTFGDASTPNLQLTGKLPFEDARTLVRDASVYLSTSQETFGIGTCEALAAAVPVLGWAWGGNLDIVRHMETGYLARVGDYDDLQRGLELCLGNRREWGLAGREDVLSRFTWPGAIQHCAAIYREAAEKREGPRVSVIVPVYNLERYLPECLDSIIKQTSADWECIIVDDNSPGNCAEIAADYAARDARFRYCKTPRNLYLAGARNHAIRNAARGRYILPLDCDDLINERTLEALGDALDKEPGYAIAYGAMEVLEEADGRRWVSGWPPAFKWEMQLSKRKDGDSNYNMLPYCSMYRRSVWERAGGYRERCLTSEDNDFWCRATSFGSRAIKATNYPTLLYRNRPDSMSHANAWPDCTLWYPWGRDRTLTPFGAVGEPPNKMSWPVKTHAAPRVSVIIPVGPGHTEVVRDALDSVLAQTTDAWEAIVVNDSGQPINLDGFPWARYYETAEAGSGPAVARNLGIAEARAPLFALLDGDDWLMPHFLERSIAVQEQFGGYVYADWYEIGQDGNSQVKERPDFDIEKLLYSLPWAITALFSKADWEAVGGFDAAITGWEDWDFFFALATHEICGTRIPEPLWCYRYWSGTRREGGYADKETNARAMRKKWHSWATNRGAKLMACGGCKKGGAGKVAGSSNTAASKLINTASASEAAAIASGMVLLEYTGNSPTTQTLRGPRSKQSYRVGGNNGHRRIYVYAVDAPQLAALPFLKIAEPDPPQMAARVPTGPLPVRQVGRIPDADAN